MNSESLTLSWLSGFSGLSAIFASASWADPAVAVPVAGVLSGMTAAYGVRVGLNYRNRDRDERPAGELV